MGLLLKSLQYNKWVFLFATLIYVMFCLIEIPYVGMFTGNIVQGHYLLWPLFAVSGCVVINNIFKYVLELRFISLFKPLEFLGKHSMTYYVQHWIFLVLTLYVVKRYNDDGRTLAAITFIVIIVFSTLFIITEKRLRLRSENK